ncbi:hypothetical protein ACS0TY_021593 [Phlomoides rotata]
MALMLWSLLIINLSCISIASALSLNHYSKTCPNVESIVANVVKEATSEDRTVPPTLLRMHFHDCFIRSGGPSWDVPKGRKDGRTSKASETAHLPSPAFTISQLQQSFSLRGLSLEDLVALTGAHSLGFAHCSSFKGRIYGFNSSHDVDPTLRPSFAATLRSICPIKTTGKKITGMYMDSSPSTFDTTHYKLIIQGKTLFASDQALLTTPKTKTLVYKFATSKKAFHTAFANSMIKMSSLNGGQEIRKDCRFVN